jgi:hypothetical protein
MSDMEVIVEVVEVVDPCDQPDLTPDQFRMMFPAFKDPAKWPDETIAFWIDLAPIDPCLWDKMYNFGQGLWAAHEMMKFGPADGTGGGLATGGGPISSKGVGPVSVSYDLTLGTEEGAGNYNSTVYGRQFIHLARLFGMGPYQIGAVSPAPFGTAWPGPPPYPGWFG